jgi:hypothetical protein
MNEAQVEIPLTPEMAEQVAKAHENALKGQPGELRFDVEVKRADGRVEKHTLIATVTGLA